MNFHPYGDSALLINFEQQIDVAINEQVIALKEAIQRANLPTITYLIPAYCSLTVGYNVKELDYTTLCLLIKNLIPSPTLPTITEQKRLVTIPVCYETEFALDLMELAEKLQVAAQEIIELHTSTVFRVYMLGFLPGFPFMGRLPESLFCQRKATPRISVPALSVGLAGYQTGIYPSASPGGWQIIGRTPLPVFDASKEQPFLLQAGNQVQFKAITGREFYAIKKDIDTSCSNWDKFLIS